MSILGSDALGHWALGHPPDSGNAALIATVGGFTLAGQAETFTLSEAVRAGAFALSAVSAALNISESSAFGTFTLSGVADTFMVTEAESAAGFVLALGVATVDLIGHPSPPAGGFVASGVTIPLVVTIPPSIGAYALTSYSAALTRDFINWVDDPFAGSNWTADAAPAPSWSAANSQPSSWQNKGAPTSSWSSVAMPSTTWTADPAEQILPPVSH